MLAVKSDQGLTLGAAVLVFSTWGAVTRSASVSPNSLVPEILPVPVLSPALV